MAAKKLSIIGLATALVVALAAILYFAGFRSAEASEPAADDQQQASAAENSNADEAAQEKAPVPVRVAPVERGEIASYISASANLVPENVVKVLAEAEGRVAELKVEEGDRVEAGGVLALLNPDELQIAVSKARLKAANADRALARATETLEQGLISREEYDRLQMEHEMAAQEVAEAEWKLSKTVIRAPFAGRVTERFANLGEHLRPGDQVFTIADFEPLIARIYLPERDVLNLQTGRRVRVSLAADADLRFAGTIRQISPVVDTATGTVKVTVEALNPPAEVRPGAFVSIDIVRQAKADALLVPRESVVRELRHAHVFIRDGDEAVKRAVTVGLEEGSQVEILSGIELGDDVIVAGLGGLKSGTKIKVLES